MPLEKHAQNYQSTYQFQMYFFPSATSRQNRNKCYLMGDEA